MASHLPSKFGGHRHCGVEDIFLVVEEPDCTCSRLNPLLMFISKAPGLKAHGISS